MSFFYEVSIIGSDLMPLTYEFDDVLSIGQIVEVELARRVKLSRAVVLKEVSKPDFKCKNIVNITNEFLNEKMIDIAKFISSYYVCNLGICLALFVPFRKNILYNDMPNNINDDIELSKEQLSAYLYVKKQRNTLLFADTGSGKTEIYIKLIKGAIEAKKQALLMMPEISLTPQMEKRLKKVFGSLVGIWHSKVTKKKKDAIISGLLSGEIKVIAGARSALFLPYLDLGQIVVDEEHDDSYKSEQKPKYNAKDLALFIGKHFEIDVLLGSATPAITTYTKVPYYRINTTYFETKKEFVFDDSSLGLNNTIINKIRQTIENNHQVIVFLPTRANFKYQVCDTCGKAVECPYCSVSMSLHKNLKALKCHYCGFTQMIPQNCPSCNSGIIKNFRLGTAEVELELNNIFQNKKITRFDRDEISTESKLKEVLSDFNDEKIDILVGTQMLSKGHDYHNVKLAVILGIDSILSANNYRARENAMSLLKQISGRSGRKGFGEVLIQTKNKEFFENYLIQNDYEVFLQDEREFRQELYPPYVKIAKVTFTHTNHKIALEDMQKELKQFIGYVGIDVIGFGEAPVFKVANKYRYQIILRAKSAKVLLGALYRITSTNATVDMDTI